MDDMEKGYGATPEGAAEMLIRGMPSARDRLQVSCYALRPVNDPI